MKSTADVSRGRWEELLPAIGVDKSYLKNHHGPCPMCGGKDRFRWDNKNGNGSYICSGCGSGDGFDLAMGVTGRTFTQIASEVDALVGRKYESSGRVASPVDPEKEKNRLAMVKLWDRSSPVREGGPAWKYMMRRTAQMWPGFRENHSIRIGGNLYYGIVGKIAGPDNRAVNLHITLIDEDGQKANVDPCKRVMRGDLPDGSAIRIGAAAPVMGVAEGIESAVSASDRFGIPVWACVNGNLLSQWVPPNIAREVVVFGDNDLNFVGQAKAYTLANRLSVIYKRKVSVWIPDSPGEDWNDARVW